MPKMQTHTSTANVDVSANNSSGSSDSNSDSGTISNSDAIPAAPEGAPPSVIKIVAVVATQPERDVTPALKSIAQQTRLPDTVLVVIDLPADTKADNSDCSSLAARTDAAQAAASI